LGDHVAQKGSMVAADRLRFDFAHPKPISDDELAQVEEIANRIVLQNEPVVTRLMAVDEAIGSGARALFGEKYGDEVRVVTMGVETAGERAGKAFSVELCGGTHVRRTGDIGLVSIVSEGAVAAGVRRLEAKTADGARQHLNEEARRLRDVAALLKAPADDATDRLSALIEERRKLERELQDARRKLAMGGGGASGEDALRDMAGVKVFARVVSGVEMKDLKSLADEAKSKVGSGLVVIIGVAEDGKAGVVVGVTPDATARFNAVDLVRLGSERLGGKGGGGRPDMAQAGGPDGAQAQAALDAILAAIEAKAKA
jgi:alanyl-tRNA synthetase